MTDTYDAVYSAVRSRIQGCDASSIIRDVAMQAFDVSHARALLQEQIGIVGQEMIRPSVLFRPTLSADGDMWCALLGDNLQIGCAGFGKTPADAMAAFDQEFWHGATPAARIARKITDEEKREEASAGGQFGAGA